MDDSIPVRYGFRHIDVNTWKRARHFANYHDVSYPYIGMTTRVEVGALVSACRDTKRSPFAAVLYVVMRALNEVENFRYRVYEGKPLLPERIAPNFVAMDTEEELFYFAETEYEEDFAVFSAAVREAGDRAVRTRCLASDRIDVFYASALPWLDFSDAIQPLGLTSNDSVPRIVWGRFRDDGGGVVTMPFSVTGHHGLFDGLHLGKLLDAMNRYLRDPAFLL